MVILVQTVVNHATKRAKVVIRPRVSVNTAVNQDGRATFVKQVIMILSRKLCFHFPTCKFSI